MPVRSLTSSVWEWLLEQGGRMARTLKSEVRWLLQD